MNNWRYVYVKLQERPSSASRCSIVRSQILVFNAAEQKKRTFSPLIKYSVDKMYFVQMHFVGFTTDSSYGFFLRHRLALVSWSFEILTCILQIAWQLWLIPYRIEIKNILTQWSSVIPKVALLRFGSVINLAWPNIKRLHARQIHTTPAYHILDVF